MPSSARTTDVPGRTPPEARPYRSARQPYRTLATDVARILVAAAIAWALCRWLGSPPAPVYAVIVPVVAMRSDPFATMDMSFTRILGVLIGVTIGIATLQLLPAELPAVLLVLAAGLVLGSLRRGTVNTQIPMSALLVVAAVGGSPQAYAWNRLWETAVGATVTFVVAVLLVPPNPVRAAHTEIQALATGMAEVLRRTATVGQESSAAMAADAADLSARAEQLADDLVRARRTGRFAPTLLRHRAALAELGPRSELARSLGRQLTTLATAVDDLAGRAGYGTRWTVVREGAAAVTTPLSAAVHGALTSGPYRDAMEGAGVAFLAFRATVPDPIATVIRHPMRRMHDQLAAFEELPPLDLGRTG